MKLKKPIPSPCISVCTMDENTGFCNGCRRTLDEIAQWDGYDGEARANLLLQLAKRKPELDDKPSAHC